MTVSYLKMTICTDNMIIFTTKRFNGVPTNSTPEP